MPLNSEISGFVPPEAFDRENEGEVRKVPAEKSSDLMREKDSLEDEILDRIDREKAEEQELEESEDLLKDYPAIKADIDESLEQFPMVVSPDKEDLARDERFDHLENIVDASDGKKGNRDIGWFRFRSHKDSQKKKVDDIAKRKGRRAE